MVKCKNCGIVGAWNDRNKFMQHGYPKDFSVRLSCISCGSYDLKNTIMDNLSFYLFIGLIFIIVIGLVFLSLIR